MKSFFPIALLLLTACTKGSPRLEGKWVGTKSEGVEANAQAAADAFAQQTVLEFKGDAVAIRTVSGLQTAHYKVKSDDKQSVVIVTDKDGNDEAHTFVFDGPKSMHWKILPSQSIVLAKQEPTAK